MKIPLLLGIVFVLIFFIPFVGWLYNLISGTRELILDDKYYKYRIMSAVVASIIFMAIVFFLIATIFECKKEKREGVFATLDCSDYQWLSSTGRDLFHFK